MGKYELVKKALEEHMETKFKNAGNTFNSCFQYVERGGPHRLYRKVKIYNKLLAML